MGQAIASVPLCTTPTGAARQLAVDVRAVHRMIASGDLKVIDVPGKVRARVLQSSVDELQARLRASAEQASPQPSVIPSLLSR